MSSRAIGQRPGGPAAPRMRSEDVGGFSVLRSVNLSLGEVAEVTDSAGDLITEDCAFMLPR